MAAFVATWWPLFAPRPTPALALAGGLTVITLNVLATIPSTGAGRRRRRGEPGRGGVPGARARRGGGSGARPRRPLPAPCPGARGQAGSRGFSKYPLRDAEPLRLSEGGNWNQRLVVETPQGPLTLFNVHPAVPSLRAEGPGPFGLPIIYDTARPEHRVARLVELLDGAAGPSW